MKFLRRIRKINTTKFVLGIMLLFLITLPTVITLHVLKAADRLEEKREAAIQDVKQAGSANAPAARDISSEMPHMVTTEDIIREEPENVETMVAEPSVLMMAEPEIKATVGDATTGDAKAADAVKVDAKKAEKVDSKKADAEKTEKASAGEPQKLNGKTVYLTFDDGPSKYTDELLDVLDKYDVKATFFVVVNSYKYGKQLKRIVNDGHTLGLHSYSHVYSKLYADYDSYVKDVSNVHDMVQKITGVDTRYYRFPGGSSNDVSSVSMSKCIKYLNDNGYTYFDWNAESKDAEDLTLTAEELRDNVLNYVNSNEGNSIVLMHDLDKHYNTVEALPLIIEALKEEGYTLSAIDDTTPTFHHRDK